MASTFELCVEEFFHDLACCFIIDITSRHDQYIGVVVQAGHVRNFWNPNQCSTDTLMLIECHADTFTTTADGNTRITFASLNSYSQLVSIIRVVTTICAVSTIILKLLTFGFEPSLYIFFQFVTSVGTCQSNCFH